MKKNSQRLATNQFFKKDWKNLRKTILLSLHQNPLIIWLKHTFLKTSVDPHYKNFINLNLIANLENSTKQKKTYFVYGYCKTSWKKDKTKAQLYCITHQCILYK